MEANFALNTFRSIVATIDRAIYNLISFLYEILNQLANQQIFQENAIDEFAIRVYTFIGLIMVFKVTFSLINYLVNPDTITDKVSGASNIAKNIIITLFMIILTPYAFDFLYRAQSAIITDQLIAKVILGTTDTETTSLDFKMDVGACGDITSHVESYGDYMAILALRPFYQISDTKFYLSNSPSSSEKNVVEEYCNASNTSELLVEDLYKADEGAYNVQNNVGKYIIDYNPILSTASGVIVLVLLLTSCFEIALRAIKLGFLEIIAPIPIISYVDPKSGKDGIFKKWLKEVTGTWASLFIRLTAIYFAIYIIQLIGKSNIFEQEHGIWLMLFLLIGALMFAKQFPKLIEDIFGFKLDSLSLHPIKKFKENALGGEMLAKLPGKAATDLAARGMSAIGSVQRNRNAKKAFADDMANAKTRDKAALNQKLVELRNQKTNGIITADEWRTKALEAKKSSVENQNAVQAAYDSKFSNRHPILSGIIANQRAGKAAFDMDPKSIQDVVKNASAAAEKAAKMRTYTDNYTAMDRLQNIVTNWGDIKYKGGTADLIDSNIKELNDNITNVTNALDSLRQQQGMFPAGTFAFNTSTGEIGLASGITNPAASENIRQTKELQKTLKDLNSEVKRQSKILEQQNSMNKK